MPSDVAISVDHVSKAYTIWRDPAARLKHPILKLAGELCPPLRHKIDAQLHGLCSEFYALSDISFEVKKGESVGIIGRNGSGKSTLLQIIAGTLQPSNGSVTVNGRVAALLELGSGFNPEFTGRENVYLNASILGLTREETDARFDKMVAFADIGDFINQPVKTYSSGMVVRLAFAVQSMIDPDILIIDEALAVGDYFFQQKCAKRMRELKEAGTTLIFVSHDMASVRDLCQKALYLQKGESVFWGESNIAINYYFNEKSVHHISGLESEKDLQEGLPLTDRLASNLHGSKKTPSLVPGKLSQEYLNQLRSQAVWWIEPSEIPKNRDGAIIGLCIYNEDGIPGGRIQMGEKIILKGILFSNNEKKYHIAVEFKNRYDQIINSSSTYTAGIAPINIMANSFAEIEFSIISNIEAGEYSYQMILGAEDKIANTTERIHATLWQGPLTIQWDYENKKAPFLGMFGLPVTIGNIQKWI